MLESSSFYTVYKVESEPERVTIGAMSVSLVAMAGTYSGTHGLRSPLALDIIAMLWMVDTVLPLVSEERLTRRTRSPLSPGHSTLKCGPPRLRVLPSLQ